MTACSPIPRATTSCRRTSPLLAAIKTHTGQGYSSCAVNRADVRRASSFRLVARSRQTLSHSNLFSCPVHTLPHGHLVTDIQTCVMRKRRNTRHGLTSLLLIFLSITGNTFAAIFSSSCLNASSDNGCGSCCEGRAISACPRYSLVLITSIRASTE